MVSAAWQPWRSRATTGLVCCAHPRRVCVCLCLCVCVCVQHAAAAEHVAWHRRPHPHLQAHDRTCGAHQQGGRAAGAGAATTLMRTCATCCPRAIGAKHRSSAASRSKGSAAQSRCCAPVPTTPLPPLPPASAPLVCVSLRAHVCVCVSVLQVKQMSSEDTEHKDLFKRNLSHGSLAALAGQVDAEAEFTVSQAASPQVTAPAAPVANQRSFSSRPAAQHTQRGRHMLFSNSAQKCQRLAVQQCPRAQRP